MIFNISMAVVTLVLGYYDNYTYLWKKIHSKDYHYLMCAWWSFSPIGRFYRWAENNAWYGSKEKITEEYSFYLALLWQDGIYKKAPAEVQEEAEAKLKEIYENALDNSRYL